MSCQSNNSSKKVTPFSFIRTPIRVDDSIGNVHYVVMDGVVGGSAQTSRVLEVAGLSFSGQIGNPRSNSFIFTQGRKEATAPEILVDGIIGRSAIVATGRLAEWTCIGDIGIERCQEDTEG